MKLLHRLDNLFIVDLAVQYLIKPTQQPNNSQTQFNLRTTAEKSLPCATIPSPVWAIVSPVGEDRGEGRGG